MSTIAAPISLAPRARTPAPAIVIPTRAPRPATSWLERLAAWAEARPAHRRLGSWERFRI
jgi:hypothetical protein